MELLQYLLPPWTFTLLMASFDEQKFLMLILFNLSFFHLYYSQKFLCAFLHSVISLHHSFWQPMVWSVTIALPVQNVITECTLFFSPSCALILCLFFSCSFPIKLWNSVNSSYSSTFLHYNIKSLIFTQMYICTVLFIHDKIWNIVYNGNKYSWKINVYILT